MTVWLVSSLRAPSLVPVIAPCWGRAKTPDPSHPAEELVVEAVSIREQDERLGLHRQMPHYAGRDPDHPFAICFLGSYAFQPSVRFNSTAMAS